MKPVQATLKEIAAARDEAIKVLDEYDFSLLVISNVLSISPKTIQRRRERLVQRKEGKATDSEVVTARNILIILLRRRSIRVEVISKILKVSIAVVYGVAGKAEASRDEHEAKYRGRDDFVRWIASKSPLAVRSYGGHDLPEWMRIRDEERKLQRHKRIRPADY